MATLENCKGSWEPTVEYAFSLKPPSPAEHPEIADVLVWRIEGPRHIGRGEWYWNGMKWVKWAGENITCWRHIIAVPLSRRPEPKFKYGVAPKPTVKAWLLADHAGGAVLHFPSPVYLFGDWMRILATEKLHIDGSGYPPGFHSAITVEVDAVAEEIRT